MLVFEFELHKVMAVFALVGTFLSFFHQGSLGGLYGVLQGRPFAFRESLAAWPTTFFLFILSAAAVGPSFVIVTTWLVSKLSGRTLVRPEVYQLLAKVSGSLLVVYVLAKASTRSSGSTARRRTLGVAPGALLRLRPVRDVGAVHRDRGARPRPGAAPRCAAHARGARGCSSPPRRSPAPAS